MTHYAVMVRMSMKHFFAHGCRINQALEAMLRPYNENTDDKQYLAFEDEHDEVCAEYAAKAQDFVRMPDGRLLSPYDESFRVPGTFGFSFEKGRCLTHEVPPEGVVEKVSVKKTFATIDAFAKKEHGYTKHPETGRFGYWHNPNSKWDWYTIGGRYAGWFPVKKDYTPLVLRSARPKPNASESFERSVAAAFARAGEEGAEKGRIIGDVQQGEDGMPYVDVLFARDVDATELDAVMRQRAHDFVEEYRAAASGKAFPPFEGPRDRALALGLLTVVKGPHEAQPGETVRAWKDDPHVVSMGGERSSWHDVYQPIPDVDAFVQTYASVFHPLKPYAVLDAQGWRDPGQMRWFGCADHNPESYLAFANAFVGTFLGQGDPSDLLVLVDCHI